MPKSEDDSDDLVIVESVKPTQNGGNSIETLNTSNVIPKTTPAKTTGKKQTKNNAKKTKLNNEIIENMPVGAIPMDSSLNHIPSITTPSNTTPSNDIQSNSIAPNTIDITPDNNINQVNAVPAITTNNQTATNTAASTKRNCAKKSKPFTKKQMKAAGLLENSDEDIQICKDSVIKNDVSIQNVITIVSKEIENENTQLSKPNDAKYTIKFKSGEFSKDFYMNDDDPVELLYKNLFGDDLEKKLIYEDMKLSRFLLAGEAGFFPGVNYVYLPENEILKTSTPKNIVIKFSENLEDDLVLQIDNKCRVSDVLDTLRKSKGIQIEHMVMVLNGELLQPNQLLDLVAENECAIDVVDFMWIK